MLNVSVAKKFIMKSTGHSIFIKHKPCPDSPSHAAIFGYTSNDLSVAAQLSSLVEEDVYPAISSDKW